MIVINMRNKQLYGQYSDFPEHEICYTKNGKLSNMYARSAEYYVDSPIPSPPLAPIQVHNTHIAIVIPFGFSNIS